MEKRVPGTNPMLENQIEANQTINKQQRYNQIIEILENKEMTAKEIAVEMCNRGYIPTSERNFTAPRLTELTRIGVIEPIGKQKCEYTGKSVTVFKLREN